MLKKLIYDATKCDLNLWSLCSDDHEIYSCEEFGSNKSPTIWGNADQAKAVLIFISLPMLGNDYNN